MHDVLSGRAYVAPAVDGSINCVRTPSPELLASLYDRDSRNNDMNTVYILPKTWRSKYAIDKQPFMPRDDNRKIVEVVMKPDAPKCSICGHIFSPIFAAFGVRGCRKRTHCRRTGAVICDGDSCGEMKMTTLGIESKKKGNCEMLQCLQVRVRVAKLQ